MVVLPLDYLPPFTFNLIGLDASPDKVFSARLIPIDTHYRFRYWMSKQHSLGIRELVFISMREDQKPIAIPTNDVMYYVATSAIPGLSLRFGTPTYRDPVMSNEASEAHRLPLPSVWPRSFHHTLCRDIGDLV